MEVGEQLPWLRHLTGDDGRALNWRDTRRNRIVLFTHRGACAACSAYARELADVADRLATWDGDLWVVGDAADAGTTHAVDAVRVTGDTADRLRRQCGLAPDAARLVVADRWGQVWQTAVADGRHTLVDPEAVLETTRFIALQCPECEALDQPAADWSSVR